jgi:hypothetical protein
MTLTFTDGSITTSVAEQDLFDITADEHFATWLFFHNMQSGDIMQVKVYVRDQNTTTSRIYENRTVTFSDVSSSPSIFIPFVSTKRYRVTIQRTGGVDRDVTWQRAQVADPVGASGGSGSSSASETFTNKTIDLKDNNIAHRSFSAIVFKVGSTYYARKYDGSLISSGSVAETVIQAAMNLHGNVFLTGHVGNPTFTGPNQIVLSGSFSGLNISEGDGLYIDKPTEIIIPNGYTGYFLRALDQGYFKVQLDGDITEAGTPAKNWTCFLLQSDAGGSGVIGGYIGGNGQVQNTGTFCELKSTSSGFITGNIFDGNFIDFSPLGFKFNSISSGPIDHNIFQNIIMEGTLGVSSRQFFKDISGDDNMFIGCIGEDFGPTDCEYNFLSTSKRNKVIGGGGEFGGYVSDLGSGNTFVGFSNGTRVHHTYGTTPDVQKWGAWYGTQQTNADGFLNGRLSAIAVGTGSDGAGNDSTGMYRTFDTGATINSIAGNRLNAQVLRRILNAYFKTAVYLNSNANVRIFAGLVASGSAPVSSADPLNALEGVALWLDTAVSANWKIMHNDNAGASTVDDTGLSASTATLYPVEIYATKDNEFKVIFNGTATSLTTNIPASTTSLAYWMYIENTTGASRTMRCYYTIVRVDK